MNQFNLSLTTLNEIQNHEDFRVVWCSQNNYVSNELEYISDYLKQCDSIEVCKQHIEKFKSERKVLLVLINLFEHAAEFDGLFQIQAIYILVQDHQNIQYEKENYTKPIHVFTNERALIDRLRHDVLLTYRNDLPISISYLDDIEIDQSFIDSDAQTYLFLWNQLFLYHLVDAHNLDMDKLKKDMIGQCQLEYANNQKQLSYIEQFSNNCTKENALKWYTSDTFAYRLVNKAFRKCDTDLICKFRYFIILLHKKLKELSEQQREENVTTVYRGQMLGVSELEKLKSNVGRLISINTFLSTTRHEDIARGLIIDANPGVLFRIKIANTSCNILHPFANITRFSTMPKEEETLFSAGGVFRINSVTKENDSNWIVDLSVSNGTVKQMEQLMNGMREIITRIINWDDLFMKINDLLAFGKYHKILTGKAFTWKEIITTTFQINISHLLSVLGDHRNAIEYYKERLVDGNFVDHSKYIILHILIGKNYFHLKEYDDAEVYYSIALSLLNDTNQLVGEIYSQRGDIYRERKDLTNALTCYDDALKIFARHYANIRDVAKTCRKIADIYVTQNKHEDAHIYEAQAEEIDQQHRQRSDLSIEASLEYFQNQLSATADHGEHRRADLLYSIGLCLLKNNDYHQALKNFFEATNLFKTHLPTSYHFTQKFSTLYDSMALVYLMLKDNFNALLMLKKSIDIRIASYCD